MDVHAEMYEKGWTHQISFYGTLKKNSRVVRIEVLSQSPFSTTQIRALRSMLERWEMKYGYVLIALTKDGLKEVVPRGLVNE